MANFVDAKYETDSGVVMLIKMDETTLPQAGTAPTGPVDLPAHAITSRSKRQAGVHARTLNLAREVGTAPNQFSKYRSIPLLTPAAYTAAVALVGTTLTFGGFTWEVNSVSPEKAV